MPITAYQHSLSAYAPDTAHGALPAQVWTDGANIKFERGAPRTIEGSADAYTVTTSVLHAINVYTTTANYWVCATNTALFTTDGTSVVDITRVSRTTTVIPYTASGDKNWTSAAFGAWLLLNNGQDTPQAWVIGASAPALEATDLPNWPASWSTAGAIRTYRNYIVAMDITISSTRYPQLVAWSDASAYDAAALPVWTPAVDNDAGDNNLNDTPGFCIDGLTLGGSFIVYKEDAVWAMTYTADSTVMSFRKLFDGVGLLTRRCVQEFNGRHFFVGRGDVYVHDGVNLQSIAAGRVRKELFDAIDSTYYERTFTAIDHSRREIWICYSIGGEYPGRALVWNYETDTWYPPRTITPTAHIAPGIVNTAGAGVTYDASAGVVFDSDTGAFDARTYNPAETELLACRPSKTATARLNYGTTEDGVAITGYLTRKLLPFDNGRDVTGQAALWTPQMKTIRRVWLDATGTGTIRVYIGVQDTESASPVWYGPFRIDLASQNVAWVMLRGRFFSIKFESDTGSGTWAMTGYRIEWEPTGGW